MDDREQRPDKRNAEDDERGRHNEIGFRNVDEEATGSPSGPV
jgi:hypothetical protein